MCDPEGTGACDITYEDFAVNYETLLNDVIAAMRTADTESEQAIRAAMDETEQSHPAHFARHLGNSGIEFYSS